MNPHNPMYGIYPVRARGGLLDLIGSTSSMSGGNSMAPMTMMIPSAAPVKISSASDSKGLVNTGQLSTLLPPLPNGTNPDVVNVMESMKRISDASTRKCKPTIPVPPPGARAECGGVRSYRCPRRAATQSAYVVDEYSNPASVNPDIDPIIVGATGIFTTPSTRQATTSRRPPPS